MAISTLDGAAGGAQAIVPYHKAATGTLVAGRPHSLWTFAGTPGAGSAAANTAGGVVPTNSTAGALSHTNPASNNSYLNTLLAISHAQAGTLLLCDRLLHIQGNSGGTAIDETLTTSQTINSTTLPSRCPTSGTDMTPSTNGYSVKIGVEVVTATGAGTPTLTFGYTNDAGTTTRTATNSDPTVASSIAGTFYRIGLQAGDTGCRSIQTYQQSATWTSGQLNLVLYRVIASIPLVQAAMPSQIDFITTGAGGRIYDNSCLFFIFIPQTTTTTQIGGTFQETQG